MEPGSFVLVHLAGPREKFWGILRAATPDGITVRGLTLEGFEEWLREIARREAPTVQPATVFFPMHRVERMFQDETVGEVVSFEERFRRQVGEDARYYLTPVKDIP